MHAKSHILDLAIRGTLGGRKTRMMSLFPSCLSGIRAEKEELIKQGKIKRDKKEFVIFKGEDNSYYEKIGGEVRCIDEEIPFEISDRWDFTRF